MTLFYWISDPPYWDSGSLYLTVHGSLDDGSLDALVTLKTVLAAAATDRWELEPALTAGDMINTATW
jgi:hypothetical protein